MSEVQRYLTVEYMKAWGSGSLASAALLGWVLALQRAFPEVTHKLGVRAPRRIMNLHLDQVMMGTILLASATAFPDLPDRVAIPLTFGTLMNPLGFLPLIFWPTCDQTLLYRGLIGVSFSSASVGFVGLAWWAYQHILL